MNVKVFSLITGMDIVAEVVVQGEGGGLVVNYPMVLGVNNNSLGFRPMVAFGAGESISMNPEQILLNYKPDDEIVRGYEDSVAKVKAKRSNIIVPGSQNKGIIKP